MNTTKALILPVLLAFAAGAENPPSHGKKPATLPKPQNRPPPVENLEKEPSAIGRPRPAKGLSEAKDLSSPQDPENSPPAGPDSKTPTGPAPFSASDIQEKTDASGGEQAIPSQDSTREPSFIGWPKPEKSPTETEAPSPPSSSQDPEASEKSSAKKPADSPLPDKIPLPSGLKKRSHIKIKALFASLKKQYGKKSANLWFLSYQEALLLKKKDRDSFCRLMEDLANDPAFPLKDLARIETYGLCPFAHSPAFEPERFPVYLRLKLAQAFYKRRKLFEDKAQTLKALKYLGRHGPYKELKVSYIKQALFYAEREEEQAVLKQLLYKEAPRLKPHPGPKDWLQAAEDFRQNRSWKKAMSFYLKVLHSDLTGFDEKNLSFKGLNRIYKIQKNRKNQAENMRQWADWLLRENSAKSRRQYYKTRLQSARQVWNRDKNQTALEMLSSLLNETKDPEIRAEAFYLRGLVHEQEEQKDQALSDYDQALRHLRKADKTGAAKPQLKEKVLWKKAWALKNGGNYRSALIHLGFLIKTCQNPYTRYRALFWRGKILFDIGQRTLAKRAFLQVAEQDQFGYYGLLARKILKQKPVFETRGEEGGLAAFSKNTKEENLIHWLILVKESDLLARFLDERKDSFFKKKNQSEQDWLKLILLWTKSEKYLDIFQSLEKMSLEVKNAFFTRHISLLFPMLFVEEVKQAARKHAVPPAFVFAVMRQESAFNRRARSPADAFGLLQLIPTTARQTAKAFKIPYKNYKELYHPKKNILLGTAHLKQLLNRYDGSFLFAASAYNAGGQPLKKWTKSLKNPKSLEFIENIPYEETRAYVKLIIRNYVFYHNQLNKDETWFPDFILQ